MEKNDDRGPAAQLCVTVLTWPSERLQTELRTFGLHSPFGNLRDFTQKLRFLAFPEKSSVLALLGRHISMGTQWSGNEEQLPL